MLRTYRCVGDLDQRLGDVRCTATTCGTRALHYGSCRLLLQLELSNVVLCLIARAISHRGSISIKMVIPATGLGCIFCELIHSIKISTTTLLNSICRRGLNHLMRGAFGQHAMGGLWSRIAFGTTLLLNA